MEPECGNQQQQLPQGDTDKLLLAISYINPILRATKIRITKTLIKTTSTTTLDWAELGNDHNKKYSLYIRPEISQNKTSITKIFCATYFTF